MIRLGLASVVAAAVAGLPNALWGVMTARGNAAPQWHVVVSGHAVPDFKAVTALSSREAWAVGTASKLPIAAHWDGRSLTVMNPFPASVTGSLNGVAALSPDDVWAVGTLDIGARSEQGVIVHWDGARWQTVDAPLPPQGGLVGVTATTDSDVWVGGTEDAPVVETDPPDSGVVDGPLILHWDGNSWSRADGSALVRTCPQRLADDGSGQPAWLWECGSYLVAIDATSKDNVWAAVTDRGFDFSAYGSVVLHFDGTSWSRRMAATQDDLAVVAEDVEAKAPEESWALDSYIDPASDWQYHLVHWTQNGQTVHRFEYTMPGAAPQALAAVSKTSVWIVGRRWNDDGSKPLGPIVLHWNGRRTTRMNTTLDSKRDATLTCIDALSPLDIWAAGDHLLALYSQ
jgi:hypothetical protein